MPTAIKAAQNGDAATDAAVAQVSKTVVAASHASTVAGDIVARTIEALTVLVRSAVFLARELFDGSAAEFKKVAALTFDDYHQAGLCLGDPAAWV